MTPLESESPSLHNKSGVPDGAEAEARPDSTSGEVEEGHDEEEPLPGFAPDDLDDGRQLFSPKSRWSWQAKLQIGLESAYLFALLAGASWYALTLLTQLENTPAVLGVSYSPGLVALTGGVLGGTLFALKWHYHVVAKGMWHSDRLIWRIFTPLISGVVSLTIAMFVISGVLMIIDRDTMTEAPALLSVGVLIGYFSDNAIAALATLAERIFGPPSSHRGRNIEPPT
jgi:hypothetical protein